MEFRDYWRIIVRRGWIVVVMVLLVAASAYGWSAAQPAEYRATTRIQANAKSLDWGRLQALKQRLSSYPDRIRSENFAFRVVDNLKLDQNPYDLLGRVQVSPQINELVLQIDATDREPESAGRIANAFADEFLLIVEQENADQLREDQVEMTVIQRAGAGGKVAPNPGINAAAGALLGLLLGALVVLALELLDDTIKSRDDIERYLGKDLLVLGQVPPGKLDLITEQSPPR